jgi:hypothetical protein
MRTPIAMHHGRRSKGPLRRIGRAATRTRPARRRPQPNPLARLVDRVTAMARRARPGGAKSPHPTEPAHARPTGPAGGVRSILKRRRPAHRRSTKVVANAAERFAARKR